MLSWWFTFKSVLPDRSLYKKKGKNILSGISYTVGNAGQFTMTSLFAYNCLNKYLITSIFWKIKLNDVAKQWESFSFVILLFSCAN